LPVLEPATGGIVVVDMLRVVFELLGKVGVQNRGSG
jgi:hypothetical protein